MSRSTPPFRQEKSARIGSDVEKIALIVWRFFRAPGGSVAGFERLCEQARQSEEQKEVQALYRVREQLANNSALANQIRWLWRKRHKLSRGCALPWH
jgi:hypothetical protein